MSSDSSAQLVEAAPSEKKQFNATRPALPADDGSNSFALWIVRGILIALTCAMAWHTWAHWGDFQIDSGRELYVPVAILHGKLLYRDLWYMYGPLAPYIQALLFLIFGIHLNVLYIFGLALTAASALSIFEITRQFDLGLPVSAVPSVFFLVEAFYPSIFNFVYPYSYAASLASFLGLVCLYFVIRHATSRRTMHLGLAALFGGLAVLTKQEFGFACVVMLSVEVLTTYLIRRRLSELLRNVAVCVVGAVPALAGYGWLTWKISAKTIYFDNWISTPGTYFMRTYGKHTMALNGFRFVPRELLSSLGIAAFSLTLWWIVAYANTMAISKFRRHRKLSIPVLLLDVLVLASIILQARGEDNSIIVLLAQVIYPRGLALIGFAFVIHSIWKLWKSPKIGLELSEAVLGTYAVMVSIRVMMEVRPSPSNYAVFFDVPLFLIFVIMCNRSIGWAGRSLQPSSVKWLSNGMWGAEVAMLLLTFFPKSQWLSTPLTTGFGTFYTRHDVSILFPDIISFMKTHTRNGRDILVLPEPPSLYVFAGMESPTEWYSLLPGVVAPNQEQEFIRQAASNDVRYVLLSNRGVREYGLDPFGIGYNQEIYRWIQANFKKVDRFGPLPNSFPGAYIMSVYERNDVNPAP